MDLGGKFYNLTAPMTVIGQKIVGPAAGWCGPQQIDPSKPTYGAGQVHMVTPGSARTKGGPGGSPDGDVIRGLDASRGWKKR